MNPIDRATAQQKKYSPVWKYTIRMNFDIKAPYRTEETEEGLIVIGRGSTPRTAKRIKDFFKLPDNEYGISLEADEYIEKVIPRESYILTGYIYYDDPEETDEQRRKYIESSRHHNPSLRDTIGLPDESIVFKDHELVSIERVKDEKPFDYQPSDIK